MNSGSTFGRNRHAEFNQRLFRWMSEGDLNRSMLDVLLNEYEGLPQPYTDDEQGQLLRSRLHQTVPNLVSQIGRAAAMSGAAKQGV